MSDSQGARIEFKDGKQYEGQRNRGMSKSRTAAIANTPGASKTARTPQAAAAVRAASPAEEVAAAPRSRPLGARPASSQARRISDGHPVPAGSDVSAGTYRCTTCGYERDVDSTRHLPSCPRCDNGSWAIVNGWDSVDGPYPDRAA